MSKSKQRAVARNLTVQKCFGRSGESKLFFFLKKKSGTMIAETDGEMLSGGRSPAANLKMGFSTLACFGGTTATAQQGVSL